MSSSSAVFDSLRELFPQVDLRILRAASVEHPNDADRAAEFILHEVLPSLGLSFDASCALHVARSIKGSSSYEVVVGQPDITLEHEQQVHSVNTFFQPASNLVEHIIGSPYSCTNSVHFESLPAEAISGYSQSSLAGDLKKPESVEFNEVSGELMSTLPSVAYRADRTLDLENGGSYLNPHHWHETSDACPSNAYTEQVPGYVISKDRQDNDVAASSTSGRDALLGREKSTGVMLDLNEEYKDVKNTTDEFEEKLPRSLVENTADLRSYDSGKLSGNDCSQSTTVITRSGHFVNINFLEDFITDAKSSKRSLLSAVESVTNLIKEVEQLEEKAKQAKEETSTAGGVVFTKVEELKQMVKCTKEANDMHAGEVFGERSILATEARELLSRLLRLSDERNKHLAIIEEIRQTLERRLAAAEEEIRAAEKERLEREAMASKALNEQELIVNALVEESKKLQQEAVENSKLRESLVERGCAADVLQGEVAVICENVLLLKERVDGHLPLSKSLRSSTMSSLTSSLSLSSHRNMSPERPAPAAGIAETHLASEEQSFMGQQMNRSSSSNAEACGIGRCKESSLDDGWEFCGNEALMHS